MMQVMQDPESRNAVVLFDDETVMGNFTQIQMDDHQGLELIAKLCDFYESKGLDVVRLLNLAQKAKRRTFWQRLFGGTALVLALALSSGCTLKIIDETGRFHEVGR